MLLCFCLLYFLGSFLYWARGQLAIFFFFFIAHRVQRSHCSSIVHRVLLTHALALSASQFVHKKKSRRIYTIMHSAGLELTKLTYTRLEDNLIRHRGDRYGRPCRPKHHAGDRPCVNAPTPTVGAFRTQYCYCPRRWLGGAICLFFFVFVSIPTSCFTQLTRTLVVLDVNGWKYQHNVKNTHGAAAVPRPMSPAGMRRALWRVISTLASGAEYHLHTVFLATSRICFVTVCTAVLSSTEDRDSFVAILAG